MAGPVSVMEAFVKKARLAVAVLQVVVFNLGLGYSQQLAQANGAHEAILRSSSVGLVPNAPASRRPPRWPGRSKNQKGLAIREASARKPLAWVI